MDSFDRLFDRLGRRMDEMFDSFDMQMDSMFPEYERSDTEIVQRYANVTVRKTPTQVVIGMDVPGLSSEDIAISLDNGILTIKAQGKPVTGRKVDIHRRFRVSEATDLSDVAAVVSRGILTVTIERNEMPEAPKGSIPVQEG